MFIGLLLFVAACSTQPLVIFESNQLSVEVADTFEERAQGLMFRESLARNTGMIFVFEQEQKHSFWMKNTLISLEMIHIDENLEVVDILHAVPCEQDPCTTYVPQKESLYVLEVNKGFSEKNNIHISDKVTLKNVVVS